MSKGNRKVTSDKKFSEKEKMNIVGDKKTVDGFSNVLARLGLSTDNLSASSMYGLSNFISRDRAQLDAAYRSSWLVGRVVDAVAEDMTKDGVTFFSEMDPDSIEKMQASLTRLGVWQSLADTIKWARLYGGAIAVILTDGADYSKPLRYTQVGRNTFRGLLVLDRWMIEPSVGELITEISKDMGMPKFYHVIPGISSLPDVKIHYTRVLRFDGIKLPYYQRLFENLWGLSVVERMLDRLLAFDSATQGAAQLLYKTHLRVVKIKGFREALALGGKTEDAVVKQFEYIRRLQANEGLTVLDADDEFDYKQNSFSGIAELIDQFATQISGATNIPIVRLFGQSPSGFSTGETDLRNYYDDINKNQESTMRAPLTRLFEVICKSETGEELPEDFNFDFNPLWTLSDSEKATISATDVNSVSSVFSQGILKKSTALKELRQQSRVTGRFTNILEEEIEEAEAEPPEPDNNAIPGEEGAGVPGVPGQEPTEQNQPTLEEYLSGKGPASETSGEPSVSPEVPSSTGGEAKEISGIESETKRGQ